MRKLVFLSFAFLASASMAAEPSTSTRPNSAFEWPWDMRGKSVLFVGAHPDDEWGVAPLMADACLDQGARCHFVIASEAKSYGCLPTIGLKDPIECSRLRRAEMQSSAAMFNAKLDFLGFEDLFYAFNREGLVRTIDGWAAEAGGREALARRFDWILQEHRPDLIFTLDPRHGSTCHSSHRATARLLIDAVKRLPAADRPVVWLEQTDNIDERSAEVAQVNAQIGYVGWPDTISQTVFYDGNRKLRNGAAAYDYALAVRRAHKSQFPDEALGKVAGSAPPSGRRVPLSPLPSDLDADFCTALKLDRPTFDIPGNRERFGIE